MAGKTDAEAALQEAWEEAGVRAADISDTPIGSYRYEKGLNNGGHLPVEADVYLARVEEMRDDFPEAAQRTRTWFAPAEAAALVDEPDLGDLLRRLSR